MALRLNRLSLRVLTAQALPSPCYHRNRAMKLSRPVTIVLGALLFGALMAAREEMPTKPSRMIVAGMAFVALGVVLKARKPERSARPPRL